MDAARQADAGAPAARVRELPRVHRAAVRVLAAVQDGWRFFHADGTPYGQTPEPDRADVFRIAREVLCKMGFKDREAKQAIADCRAHAGTRPTVEEVVAAALRAVPGPPGSKRYGRTARPSAVRESLAPYTALPVLDPAA